MSTTVDQRVVEMRFENRQFENNVATSMSTLEKLKRSLNLTGASKGLENVNTAAKNVNMSGLGSAVETVRTKFSALEVIGVTALVNITNSAVNAGERIVAAMTIDPISTGFNEYELKMNSVQTIMASTGESLETVNRYLEELNEYSDKTIYSFSDMTQNIGKFTNAGVKLEDAVMAIKGISNEAAVSGANANEASRAMYNFAQALSAGHVKLIDWKSIENANMATVEFKEQLIDAAVAAGTLEKSSDGMYKVLTSNNQGSTMDDTISATKNFNDSLNYQWMTTEVLINTLKDYADETTDIGKKASEAATQVKTWTQLVDTLKESLQSGWAKTWEIIFGDFYEARDFFTMLSNTFGKIIDKMSTWRNDLLEGALGNSKWDAFVEKIDKAGISVDDFTEKLKEVAKKKNINNIDDVIKKFGSLEKAVAEGEIPVSLIVDTLKEFAGIGKEASKSTDDMTEKLKYFQKVVDQVWHGDFKNGKERIEALTEAGYNYAEVQELVNKTVDGHRLTLEDLSEAQLKNIGYTDDEIKAIQELAEEAEKTGSDFNELINNLSKPSGRELLIDSFKNVGKAIGDVIKIIKESWVDVFGEYDQQKASDSLYNLIEKFHELTESMQISEEAANNFKAIMEGVFSGFKLGGSLASKSVMGAIKLANALLGLFDMDILDVAAKLAGYITKFADWVENNTIFGFDTAYEDLAKILVAVAEGVGGCVKAFLGLEEATGIVKGFKNIVVKGFNAISGVLDKFSVDGIVESITKFFDSIESWIKDGHRFSDLGSYIMSGLGIGLGDGLKTLVGKFLEVAKALVTAFCDFFGIESPSKLMITLGGFIITGLVLGLTGNFPVVWDTVKNLGTGIIDIIKNLDIGTVLAGILSVGMFLAAKKVMGILEMFGALPEGLGKMFANIGEMFGEITNVFVTLNKIVKAKVWQARSEAILNFAKAIGILALSVALLTYVDQDKLLGAVGAIVVLAGVVAGLAMVSNKMNGLDFSFGKMALGLMGVSVAILILAVAVKQLSKIDADGAVTAINTLASLVVAMSILILSFGLVMKLLEGSSMFMDKAGIMMFKMAAALLIMTFVVKAASKFESQDVYKAIGFVAGIGLLFAAIVMCSKLAGEYSSKAGTLLLKMSIAMAIMVGVVKLASMLDMSEINRAVKMMAAVELLFAGMLIISRIAGQNSPKAGSMLLLMAGSIAVIVMAVKMISGITDSDIDRGLGVISKLMVLFAALIAVSHFAGQNAAKAGIMLLTMAGALVILTVVLYLLSNLVKHDPENLMRALVIVGVLEALFAGLIFVTKYAQDCSKTLGMMIGVIAALTIAVVALSLIDEDRLKQSVGSLSVLMVAFGILVASSKFATSGGQVIKSALIMVAVMTILSGVVWMLSKFDAGSAIQNATALSILLIALSGALMILDGVGNVSTSALVAAGVLTLVMAGLAGILGALSVAMTQYNVQSLIPATTALSVLLGALVAAVWVLGKSGNVSTSAMVALIPLTIVTAGLAVILAKLAEYSSGGSVDALIPTAVSLSTLLIAMTVAVGILSLIGPAASAAIPAMGSLAIVIAELAGILVAFGLIAKLPFVTELIEGGGELLAKIGYAIGDFVGSIIGGLGAGMSSGLPEIGENLAKFMEHMNSIPESAINGVKSLAQAMLILTAAEFVDSLFRFPWEDSPIEKFAEQIPTLVDMLKRFSAGLAETNIDVTKVKNAAEAIKAIANASAEIPNEGGLIGLLAGENSIATFAEKLPALATHISSFANNLGTFDESTVKTVECAGNAIKALAQAASEIPNEGGLAAIFAGENSISVFGAKLPMLGVQLASFATNLGKFDDSTVKTVECAGNAIKSLAAAGSEIDGQAGWSKALFGDNGLAAFGEQLGSVGSNLSAFAKNLGTFNESKVNSINCAIRAIKALATLADTDLKAAKKNLPGFGDELSAFATDVKNFCKELEDVGTESIDKLIKAVTNTAKLGELKEAGVEMINRIIKGIESKEKTFKTTAEDLAESGADAVSDCESEFKSAGKDLGDGLVAGIEAKETAAYNAGYSLGQAAVQGEKDGQASASPSKLTIKAGKWLGEGLVIGMEKMFGAVYNSGKDLGSSATNSISNAIARISGMIDTDMDLQPTIRPVLDLSDISAGASSIGSMFGFRPAVAIAGNVSAISSMMSNRQNGSNNDVVSAIKDLKKSIGKTSGDTYIIDGVTYDDGSNISTAVKEITRAAIRERRS